MGAVSNELTLRSIKVNSSSLSGAGPVEFDVVVVGSGIGGCATAAAAADNGLHVLVVEKTDRFGGAGTHGGGSIWLPGNHQAQDLGIVDSVAEGIAYIESLAGGWGDDRMTRRLFEAANDALDYFESRYDFRAHLMRGMCDYYYPNNVHSLSEGRYVQPDPFDVTELGDWQTKLRRAPGPAGGNVVGGGEALAAYFFRAALRAGAEVWTESSVVELTLEQGAVAGVVVDRDNESITVAARLGVVLATGGYDWNLSLVNRFEGALDGYGSMAPPGVDGDHLTLSAPVGAAITALPPQRNVMMFGFPTGTFDEGGNPRHFVHMSGHPHELIVNRAGSRFANESFYPSVSAAIQVLDGNDHSYPNWPIWLVFDQSLVDSQPRPAFAAVSTPENPALPPTELVIKADTLEDLATSAGIDPAGLVGTVSRYNQLCAEGKDGDFGRGEMPWLVRAMGLDPTTLEHNAMLGPIEKAPYYAARLSRVNVGVPAAGLEVNDIGQVMNLKGDQIPGLYAVGNAAANDIGVILQSGLPNLRGLTYGYLVGRHLAGLRASN
jgi:3-oxosteroid 1-dehydrogenase